MNTVKEQSKQKSKKGIKMIWISIDKGIIEYIIIYQ